MAEMNNPVDHLSARVTIVVSPRERFEQAALNLRWQAGAFVADGEFDLVAQLFDAEGAGAAAFTHGFEGVAGKVDEGSLHLAFVAAHGAVIGGVDFEVDVVVLGEELAQHVADVAHEVVHVHLADEDLCFRGRTARVRASSTP